jgi:hypothetical protein
MKALGNPFSVKAVLIPVILTVSQFLVFLGMREPDLLHTQKSTEHHRVVIENQIKEAKTGTQNSGQDYEICCRTDLIESPSFHVSSFRLTYHSKSYTKVFPIPFRAPPTFYI